MSSCRATNANAAHDAETRRLLAAGAKVVYTEKLDGTLIIRSVIDGKVHLRTRGNHSLGDFEAPVMALIRERYPLLLETGANGSLGWSHVFEYTAPTNRIVVAYDEAKLTALGCVDHETGAFEPDQDPWFDVALVERRDLDADPDAAAKQAAEMTGDEGVVAWIERPDGSCHLVKMKSLWWLRAHALRLRPRAREGGRRRARAFGRPVVRRVLEDDPRVRRRRCVALPRGGLAPVRSRGVPQVDVGGARAAVHAGGVARDRGRTYT
jgi:hypothetical protein